jgi:NACalpha-BTF3-like transcription factor
VTRTLCSAKPRSVDINISQLKALTWVFEQMEDMNAQAQLSAAQQLAASGAGSATTVEDSRLGAGKGGDNDDDVPDLEPPEDDGPVDETGVDPKDIELVMKQVNCSRAKAVRVLKESGGDLINASAYMFFRIRGLLFDSSVPSLVMAASE